MAPVVLLPRAGPAFSLDTFVDDGVTYGLNPPSATPSAIWFSSDGTRMFTGDTTASLLVGYDLPVAWDLTSIVGVAFSQDVSTWEPNVMGVHAKEDGTSIWITGNNNDDVVELAFSAPPFGGTVGFVKSLSLGVSTPAASALRFSPNGTKLFVADRTAATIRQWTLGTAWDIDTAVEGTIYNTGLSSNQLAGLAFGKDGRQMFISNTNADVITEYDLSPAWDSSSASLVQSKSTTPNELQVWGIYFKPDGRKMYTVNPQSDVVRQWTTGEA